MYIYIYIYIERERERDSAARAGAAGLLGSVPVVRNNIRPIFVPIIFKF